MKNADMPAMPLTGDAYQDFECTKYKAASNGLTKREMFAMAAMQGILARAGSPDRNIISKTAIEYADALLKELDK